MIKSLQGMTPRIAETAFVSEAAYVIGDVEIGAEASVWPGAVLRGDCGRITIGRYTAIEDHCVVHSGTPASTPGDVSIGERVIVGHGAMIHCRRIGNGVLIGIQAVVLHDAEIGDNCVIGAGCVVPAGMKVPANSLVLGVPGKIKGNPTPAQLWWTREGYKEYLDLLKAYKEEGL